MTDCKCGCHISKIFPNTQCGKCYSDPCSHYKNWSTGKLTFVPDPLSDRIEALEKRVESVESDVFGERCMHVKIVHLKLENEKLRERSESLENQIKTINENHVNGYKTLSLRIDNMNKFISDAVNIIHKINSRIESLEQQVKEKGESKPFECPVCSGWGYSVNSEEKKSHCHSCQDKGVLWS